MCPPLQKQLSTPNVTDLSYSPDSTVKSIKQQQKILAEAEVQIIIEKYQTGVSTYELAKEFNCHRSTIANNPRRYHMSDNAVSRRLKAAGVRMYARWDYSKKM